MTCWEILTRDSFPSRTGSWVFGPCLDRGPRCPPLSTAESSDSGPAIQGYGLPVQQFVPGSQLPSRAVLLFNRLSRHFQAELRASPFPPTWPVPASPGYSPCLSNSQSLQFQSLFSVLLHTSQRQGSTAVMSGSLIPGTSALPRSSPPEVPTSESPPKAKENKDISLGT